MILELQSKIIIRLDCRKYDEILLDNGFEDLTLCHVDNVSRAIVDIFGFNVDYNHHNTLSVISNDIGYYLNSVIKFPGFLSRDETKVKVLSNKIWIDIEIVPVVALSPIADAARRYKR